LRFRCLACPSWSPYTSYQSPDAPSLPALRPTVASVASSPEPCLGSILALCQSQAYLDCPSSRTSDASSPPFHSNTQYQKNLSRVQSLHDPHSHSPLVFASSIALALELWCSSLGWQRNTRSIRTSIS
jgi:hypothetical protein